jgi:hypothetical protein
MVETFLLFSGMGIPYPRGVILAGCGQILPIVIEDHRANLPIVRCIGDRLVRVDVPYPYVSVSTRRRQIPPLRTDGYESDAILVLDRFPLFSSANIPHVSSIAPTCRCQITTILAEDGGRDPIGVCPFHRANGARQ